MSTALCGHCRQAVSGDGIAPGAVVRCPHCGGSFQWPVANVVAVQPPPLVAPTAQESFPVVAVAHAHRHAHTHSHDTIVHSNSLGIGAMVLSIVALFIFWLPFAGLGMALLGFLLGCLAIVLSFFRKGAGLGYGLAAMIIALPGFVMGGCSSIAGVAITKVPEAVAEAKKQIHDADERADAEGRAICPKFVVLSSRLSGPPTTLHFRVRNDTGEPVKRVGIHLRYAVPGRAVPTAEGEVSYEVPGGVEPGESADWNLSPNFLSKLYDVEPVDGARLDATACRLEFASGRSVGFEP